MPSPILANDVKAMLADTLFTHTLTLGSQQTRGILDWEEVAELDSAGFSVFVRRRKFAIATGSLTIAAGNTITATDDGASPPTSVVYTVHDTRRSFDGLVTDVFVVTT